MSYEERLAYRKAVLGEVGSERIRQEHRWDDFADRQWTLFDWHEMIADYNAWARRKAAMGNFKEARERYIQIAALAVAAVEAMKEGKP